MISNRFSCLSLTVLVLCALAGGCAQQIVPSTGTRTPTSPDTVKIYAQAPKQYEKLGTITIPVGGDVKWDERGDAKLGFKLLREKAAALGANGVLLATDPGQSDGRVTAGDGTEYYQVPVSSNPRSAVAQAIFVLKP